MTKYISLFGATTTDTQVQVVKENQVIIGIGAGASRKRYVVYKVEHTARGYVYHLVNDVTLSARTRTDTDDYLVFLDYLHLRVRGSRSE